MDESPRRLLVRFWTGEEPPVEELTEWRRELRRRDVWIAMIELAAVLAIVGALLVQWRAS